MRGVTVVWQGQAMGPGGRAFGGMVPALLPHCSKAGAAALPQAGRGRNAVENDLHFVFRPNSP